MEIRKKEWETKKAEFMSKKMNELKAAILKHANDELLKEESRRKAEEVQRKRAERDKLTRELEAKREAEGGN
jgi:hypothetical protein